ERPEPEAAALDLHRHERAGPLAAEQLAEPLALVPHWRQRQHLAPIVLEAEADRRDRRREPREGVDDVGQLGRRRAQELPPRRRGAEEALDLYRRAGWRPRHARCPGAAEIVRASCRDST